MCGKLMQGNQLRNVSRMQGRIEYRFPHVSWLACLAINRQV
ncbi:hypothetical protein M495_05095 [Serratia liquefaciens ATCC 27592]|nr:hypothetical protein M495_05095 [Serratia liquefaciens ATCC 27592]